MGKVVVAVVGLIGAAGLWLWAGQASRSKDELSLLNVSYDPTREVWRDVSDLFAARYQEKTGKALKIKPSHGGSGSQARAILDGLEADIATLALWSDTDLLRKKGLIPEGWDKRLPNRSLPYFSTIVFVVRKGNPHGIHNWPDLTQGDVKIITPSPKTSGNGKLAFLAAWGSVLKKGGSEQEAEEFVRALYRRTPVLDSAARGATLTFARNGKGDVHLTWENEAHQEVAEARGELEIVYPKTSIRAEPHVTVVDAYVDRHGTRAVAEELLSFLYTEEAQEIIARHHYRPTHAEVARRHAADFPPIELYEITALARGWDVAADRFFAQGGVFDRIYEKGK